MSRRKLTYFKTLFQSASHNGMSDLARNAPKRHKGRRSLKLQAQLLALGEVDEADADARARYVFHN